MTGYDPAVSGPWSDADDWPPGQHKSRFDLDLEAALGDRIRTDREFARRVWGSVANVDWRHEDGDDEGHSFRSIGRLLAEMCGNTKPYNYMEFYCSVPPGIVDPDMAVAMGALGWTGTPIL